MNPITYKGNMGMPYVSKPPISNKAAPQRELYRNFEGAEKKNSSFNKESPDNNKPNNNRGIKSLLENSPNNHNNRIINQKENSPSLFIQETPIKKQTDISEKFEHSDIKLDQSDEKLEKNENKLEKSVSKDEKKEKIEQNRFEKFEQNKKKSLQIIEKTKDYNETNVEKHKEKNNEDINEKPNKKDEEKIKENKNSIDLKKHEKKEEKIKEKSSNELKKPEKIEKPQHTSHISNPSIQKPFQETSVSIKEIPDLYEDDLSDFLQDYFFSLPERFKGTFLSNVNEIVLKSTQEDLNFLQFLDQNSQRVGLAILHIDKNFLTFKRMSILHFSVMKDSKELLDSALKELLAWIWTKDNSEEIRINLFHKQNDTTNELELEKPLQEIFLSKGFRWKLLTNDKTSGTRLTTFGLRRKPEEFKMPEMQSEPIIFKSSSILTEAQMHKKFPPVSKAIYDNVNCQINALKSFGDFEEDQEGLSRKKLDLLTAFKNLPNFVMPGMKCKTFQEVKEIKEFLVSNEFGEIYKEIESEEFDEKVVCSLLKTCYRWENFRTWDKENSNGIEKFLRIIPV